MIDLAILRINTCPLREIWNSATAKSAKRESTLMALYKLEDKARESLPVQLEHESTKKKRP